MRDNVRVVSCYGDSVTEGMAVGPNQTTVARKGLPYPAVLQQLLGEEYLVQNAGDGGENTHSIMTRQGAEKIYLKSDVTFDVGVHEVLIDVGNGRGALTEDGVELQWTPPYGRDLPMNKVTINGDAYEFKFTEHNYEQHGTCNTFLVRENADRAVTLTKGTEISIDITATSKTNYCDIYFMGFNGGYHTDEELIAQHQKMIDYRGNDRYLIIARQDRPSTANALREAYGDHVLILVEYCAAGGMEKCGLTMTEQDKDCIQNGILPYPLKLRGDEDKNDVHLSAAGYKVLGHAVYELGRKNNLW